MKKTISVLLTLILIMSMSLNVLAEEASTEANSKEVKGTYEAGGKAEIVYSVDISWDGLDFTYTAASEGTWNPQNHVYENIAEEKWTGEGKITVTNHSNADITAVPKYDAVDEYKTASMKFDKESMTIGSAATKNGAVEDIITVTPEGSLPESTPANAVIGTITITIN